MTFWYDGVKIVDFGYPGQRVGNAVTALLASRAKVNYLFGGLAGAPGWHGGHIGWPGRGLAAILAPWVESSAI